MTVKTQVGGEGWKRNNVCRRGTRALVGNVDW